jgi:hypothetical protein
MALTRAEWIFPGSPPATEDVISRMRQTTGLAIHSTMEGTDTVIDFSPLNEQLFEWVRSEKSIAVHGFAPANPYVWTHLNLAVQRLGGTLGGNPGWRPDAKLARLNLERSWSSFTPLERYLLRMPTVLGWRPGLWILVRRAVDRKL